MSGRLLTQVKIQHVFDKEVRLCLVCFLSFESLKYEKKTLRLLLSVSKAVIMPQDENWEQLGKSIRVR